VPEADSADLGGVDHGARRRQTRGSSQDSSADPDKLGGQSLTDHLSGMRGAASEWSRSRGPGAAGRSPGVRPGPTDEMSGTRGSAPDHSIRPGVQPRRPARAGRHRKRRKRRPGHRQKAVIASVSLGPSPVTDGRTPSKDASPIGRDQDGRPPVPDPAQDDDRCLLGPADGVDCESMASSYAAVLSRAGALPAIAAGAARREGWRGGPPSWRVDRIGKSTLGLPAGNHDGSIGYRLPR